MTAGSTAEGRPQGEEWALFRYRQAGPVGRPTTDPQLRSDELGFLGFFLGPVSRHAAAGPGNGLGAEEGEGGAGLLLTTEVMVAEAPKDDEHKHGGGMPDMGDMGGMGM